MYSSAHCHYVVFYVLFYFVRNFPFCITFITEFPPYLVCVCVNIYKWIYVLLLQITLYNLRVPFIPQVCVQFISYGFKIYICYIDEYFPWNIWCEREKSAKWSLTEFHLTPPLVNIIIMESYKALVSSLKALSALALDTNKQFKRKE